MTRTRNKIIDNPIVYTYPRYHINMEMGTMEEIYEWLRPHSKVGVAKTLGPGFKLQHRIYAKLEPKILTLFLLKYNPYIYTRISPYKVWAKEHYE